MNQRLPPPLMTSEMGSFARSTIVERKPQIIKQVVEDNGYPPGIVNTLAAFQQEIAQHPIQPLTSSSSDAAIWNRKTAEHRGRTWLELPWYFAEAYFYRHLLEAVRYFQPGPWQGHDPFAVQKRWQAEETVARLSGTLDDLAAADTALKFEALLHSSLWGNRADLSNYTVQEQAQGGLAARQQRHNLLVDDTDRVADQLSAGVTRVDFINDNVGQELFYDLALADLLLDQEWAGRVVFHVKNQPFFVSDAMPGDVLDTVSLLRGAALGHRLDEYLAAGRLVLRDDAFWTGPLMYRQMPLSLRSDLARAHLVIIKGDVNYRRLLDDRHWPYSTRMEEITAYFPAPFLVLRTLKGEILVGLEPGQAEELAAQDPAWLINGKRGIIQYINRRTNV